MAQVSTVVMPAIIGAAGAVAGPAEADGAAAVGTMARLLVANASIRSRPIIDSRANVPSTAPAALRVVSPVAKRSTFSCVRKAATVVCPNGALARISKPMPGPGKVKVPAATRLSACTRFGNSTVGTPAASMLTMLR